MSRPTAPSDFGGNLCSESAYAQAKVKGYEVVLPAANELQIDIDNDTNEQLFHKNLPKVGEYVGVNGWNVQPSKSGEPERKHITVQLNRDVEPVERMLLQAVLGSDIRRELLSYCRWTLNDPHPTLFFEKGQTQLPVQAELKCLTEGCQGCREMYGLCDAHARQARPDLYE